MRFADIAGTSIHHPSADDTNDPQEAISMLEDLLNVEIGVTPLGIVSQRLPWRDAAPEIVSSDRPRVTDLGEAVNDPNWFPSQNRWFVLSRIFILVGGLLYSETNNEAQELIWINIGWQYAVEDHLRE